MRNDSHSEEWKGKSWYSLTYFNSLKPNVSNLPHDEHNKCGFMNPSSRQSCALKSQFAT